MGKIIKYIKKCRYILLEKHPIMIENFNNEGACPIIESDK